MTSGLLRRLGALLYDTLLLAALLMIVTACFLPITGGEAITRASNPTLEWIYRLALLGVVVAYYGIPWTRRGQTLGMATWRLRVERDDGSLPAWGDVLRRLAAALLSLLPAGLGWWWILVDRDRRGWHDRLSGTRVVVLPKAARRPLSGPGPAGPS
ncbi:MAG: RDD family protein [Steroidobacteraceae bacterium]